MLPGLSMRLGRLSGFIINIIVHSVEGARLLARKTHLRHPVVYPGGSVYHHLPHWEIAVRE